MLKVVLIVVLSAVVTACANSVELDGGNAPDVDSTSEAHPLGDTYQLPCVQRGYEAGRRHVPYARGEQIRQPDVCVRLATGSIVCAAEDLIAVLYPHDAPELVGVCRD